LDLGVPVLPHNLPLYIAILIPASLQPVPIVILDFQLLLPVMIPPKSTFFDIAARETAFTRYGTGSAVLKLFLRSKEPLPQSFFTFCVFLLPDHCPLLAELMEKGAKALKSSTIALKILEFFSEQERHKVARGLVLKVLYTWPASQRDLDTGTTFLGDTVGYSCGDSSTYMVWTGDDTGTGGLEQVTVLISDAASNNALPTNFDIDAKAGWYASAGGSGPASLEMYLENPMSGALYGERVSKTIAPGSQDGCATTPVGGGNFTWNPTTNELGWNLF
jgi:hypothetical protein